MPRGRAADSVGSLTEGKMWTTPNQFAAACAHAACSGSERTASPLVDFRRMCAGAARRRRTFAFCAVIVLRSFCAACSCDRRATAAAASGSCEAAAAAALLLRGVGTRSVVVCAGPLSIPSTHPHAQVVKGRCAGYCDLAIRLGMG